MGSVVPSSGAPIATKHAMLNTYRLHTFALIICLGLITAGCRSTGSLQSPEGPSVSFAETSNDIPADPEVDALIMPYRQQLQERVEEVIGEATGRLEKERGSAETTLGNMAADAMLHVINQRVDTPVDIAITNNGGLRVPIDVGPITVGKIFELMPFENSSVILEFNAAHVDSLAQQIARASGAIAGLTFTLDPEAEVATNIRVGGAPLSSDRTYRVVTSDYLANGGGSLSVLQGPIPREELPILLRDLFIDYIRQQQTITPTLDGRIQIK